MKEIISKVLRRLSKHKISLILASVRNITIHYSLNNVPYFPSKSFLLPSKTTYYSLLIHLPYKFFIYNFFFFNTFLILTLVFHFNTLYISIQPSFEVLFLAFNTFNIIFFAFNHMLYHFIIPQPTINILISYFKTPTYFSRATN